MRFASGMLGVCISVLAIVGMVLAGSVLSVSEYERTTTGYEYITDITGLFDTSQEPTYLDYNPARNWTGYYTDNVDVTNGIDFSTSSSANSYPIGQEREQLSSESKDLSSMNLDAANPPGNSLGPADTVKISDQVLPNSQDANVITWPRVALLSDIIAASNLGDYDTATITLGNVIAAPQTAWQLHKVRTNPSGAIEVYADYYILPYSTYSAVERLEISAGDDVVGYDSSGNKVFQGNVTNTTISFAQGSTATGYPQTISRGDVITLGTSLTIATYNEPSAIYLDPSEGVTLSAAQVGWTNKEINAAIDIMLRVPDVGTTYNMEFVLDLNSGDDVTVGVSVDASGNVGASITHGESTASVQAGKWRNFILSLDTRQGDYSLIPVTDFVSFYQYTALTDASYDLKLDLKDRTISGMTITSSGASLSMGIVQTSVFLDTYDVVMVDPSLDPAMYFTDLADMRLNFYSFALYGDSIEINSETYEVNNNAQIQVPVPDGKGGTIQTWTTLTNIYITFEQDHTYLTFVNDGLTVDLGETTDTTISFDGVWYFSAAIWEGYQTTETVMDWSPGDFFLDGNGAIIAFLGLLAVGTIVGARFVRGGMEALDYIVVAFAGLCGLVLLVVR